MPAKQGTTSAITEHDATADRRQRFSRICAEIAMGESLVQACQRYGTTHPTFLEAVSKDESLADDYARAREARADLYFDQLDGIGDAALRVEQPHQVQALKLVADNVKWKLARMSPKKYGDKTVNEHTGPNGGAIPMSVAIRFVDGNGQDRSGG